MKNLYIAIFFLFCITVNQIYAGSSLDGIVAIVGDEVILQSELDAYTMMRINNLSQKPDSSMIDKYKKDFLNELVEGKILLVHAKGDTTIQVTNQEVENALKNHINAILQQNNINPDSLDGILQQQQGMTLAKFKAESRRAIKEQIYKQKLQQTFLSSIKVSKKDVVDFYNQYKDSLPKAGESILLSKLSIKVGTNEKIRQAAYDKIKNIKQRIDNGESFAELAKKYSESPEAADGGDLGFISKGSLGELAFEQKAFSLSPGQTSEPFETRIGFHIINAIEKNDQKIHIRQIFIKVAPGEQQIQNIMSRLDSIRVNCKSQEIFISNVEKYSDDNLTKNKKGSMGWVALFELPSTLQSAIDTFPAGTITQPIKEENNISIYRIDDRVKSRSLTLENDYGILEEKAKDILSQKKLIELVNEWRQEIFVDLK